MPTDTYQDKRLTHRPRKRFGQNFLLDPGVIRRIVEAIDPQPGQHLVEIGPGRGAITLPLLQRAGRMDVVEMDRDLIGPLRRLCAGVGELRIHNADALRFDYCALAVDAAALRVVGNLPYNISTPLLFHLLDQSEHIQDMHFMLQKEVVERLASGPGSRDYGRLSVMVQLRCEVTPLFVVGPGAFHPTPKVDSAFVRLRPRAAPPVLIDDHSVFARLVAQAFSQRRKTLRNTLRGLVTPETMQTLEVDPGARAEELDLAAFARLANAAYKSGQSN